MAHTTLSVPLPFRDGDIRYRYMEFHVKREARDTYQFNEKIYSLKGNVIFSDFKDVREFAEKVNKVRKQEQRIDADVSPAEIHALGLIDEILHHVIHLYLEKNGQQLFSSLMKRLKEKVGESVFSDSIKQFCYYFPPVTVYKQKETIDEYLKSQSGPFSHVELALEELLILWITNKNPACEKYIEFFDESLLDRNSAYNEIITEAYLYFHTMPGIGSGNMNLIDFLRTPALVSPHSLFDQLTYMRDHWDDILGDYLTKLLKGLDFIQEEKRAKFPPGPGPSYVYRYEQEEIERFSQDTHWMPRVVLIAKSTLVWLDQLSKKYGYPITRLDLIPDEELNMLADQGFTALWLIGTWERSKASKTIKQACGNPEAEASAYSLKQYEIAHELGGWESLSNLRYRCSIRGIRLASDMVPNHTGIDSEWVVNHPDWFLSLDYAPYPAYSFNGPNLSPVPWLGIYIEDHYYDKTDAAVTFKRIDFNSGDTKYIYHGNDGTSMPWNDTAQLDFLNPETREAVINTIIHVAKNFSIIRFDAAMTLAKRHIQRLWYPEPGTGGDIPSRAEHSISNHEFHRKMPKEFWREVVDRIAQEAPDTLLLAEAFWMMEGYFVRTLGMHRVYNSAFMNMLKDEENQKYRTTIKNTIAFDPEILKRFVNFMNNPDEETAVTQFGKGDKYFGVCLMLATMPGLPMFGHGQVEGFYEKYGMEYKKAYWDEVPDWELVEKHYQLIFPLLKKRALFAEVYNFLFFDVHTPEGAINENVFAWFNRNHHEAGLIFYNNSYNKAGGWINESTYYASKDFKGNRVQSRRSLAQGLELPEERGWFSLFREHRSGLYFLRRTYDLHLHGFYIDLDGYESQVYLDFKALYDYDGSYEQLSQELDGKGVIDPEIAVKRVRYRPVYTALSPLMDNDTILSITNVLQGDKDVCFPGKANETYKAFLEQCASFNCFPAGEEQQAVKFFTEGLKKLDEIYDNSNVTLKDHPFYGRDFLSKGAEIMPEAGIILWAFLLFRPLGIEAVKTLLLDQELYPFLIEAGIFNEQTTHFVRLLEILFLLEKQLPLFDNKTPEESIRFMLDSNNEFGVLCNQFVNRNWSEGIEWFNGEAVQEISWWFFVIGLLTGESISYNAEHYLLIALYLLEVEETAEYRVERLFI